MASMNKAISIFEYGDPTKDPTKGLRIIDRKVPVPEKGQVRVRITLRPVNPADIFGMCGTHPSFKPDALPGVPGIEGVGYIDSLGEGSDRFSLGQRVVAAPWNTRRGEGSWQQYAILDEAVLIEVPDTVSDESAAQAFINPVTAYGLLDVLKIPKGEWLVQNAAGSVLGRQVVALAKHQGIKTINLVRNMMHAEELKALGADVVLSTDHGDDVVTLIREITGGKGAYAAIDPVAGPFSQQIGQSLRDRATYIIYSRLGGITANIGIADLIYRGIVVRGFWMAPYLNEEAEDRKQVLSNVMQYLAGGVIVPNSGKHYSLTNLEEVRAAVHYTREPGHGGKLFLKG